MKFKTALLELIIIGLACHVVINNAKVVGNINDEDGGTLTIVDIEDENKTHYYNQNFELGNYNYGYDVKPSGPVGQFHHENRAIDEVVYGCYGYEGSDSRNHMTFYVSDAWGYRPVRQGQDIEVFYPAENPEGTGHHNGHTVKWADLLFPDMCANVAERIASSSNVVTNAPIQLAATPVSPADRFVTAAIPSSVSPSALSSFGNRNTPVPSGSFDVIQFNTPSTIGPQPTSGRLQTVTTSGLPSSSISNARIPSTPTTQQAHGQNTNSPLEHASNNNIIPNAASTPTATASVPNGGRPTTFGSFTGARFTTPTVGTPNRPAFTGGVVQTTRTPSSSTPEEDVTDSQSSNNGPLLPNRGGLSGNTGKSSNRPVSTIGPVTTATRAFSPSVPLANNGQFSRLIPTPTEPTLNSESPAFSLPTGQTFSNSRITTRPPSTFGFSLLRTTTTPSPSTGQGSTGFGTASNSGTAPGIARTNEVPVDSGNNRPPGRQPSAGSSYGGSDDSGEDLTVNNVGTNANRRPTLASSAPTNVPSRGTTSGFPTSPASRNPITSGTPGTTRTPVGSTLVPQPVSPDSTFSSDEQSTNTQNIVPTTGSNTRRQPTSIAPGVTGSRFPTAGFSGNFNNPGTLQPSSTNQQTIPGSTSGTGTPTTLNPTGPAATTRDSNRFSTTFRQTIPTTVIPQESSTGTASSNAPTPTTRGSSPFSSSPTRSSPAPSSNVPVSSQFATSRPVTSGTPLKNATNEDFCASQCSSCSTNNQQPSHQQQQQPGTLTDEDFLRIPGALLSNIPVIFYPDCSANAYSRPAIVPVCSSQKTQCNNNQPLTMRFPDAANFIAGHNRPVARNAFVENVNQGSPRLTRRVRRGRYQRLATY